MAANLDGMIIQDKTLMLTTNEYIKNQGGHIEIPSHVTRIGWSAFSHSLSLQSVTIPSSATKIGQFVFFNCANLQSVVMSDSVTKVGESAFFGCINLTEITIIVSDPSYKKAEKLKNMLPKRLHDKVKFELSAACCNKGNPPTFFSPSSDTNSNQPESSNNSPAP